MAQPRPSPSAWVAELVERHPEGRRGLPREQVTAGTWLARRAAWKKVHGIALTLTVVPIDLAIVHRGLSDTGVGPIASGALPVHPSPRRGTVVG